ncbi:MAG: mannose-1-phosphate guanylyltransferase [Bacteroidales bacterium]|jgi:mannose-1-phosphate guanylyltransferase|nr:mannose-1-phosphate guanylyltransferase [Bacteroidales bacterium]NLM93469.1 NTP transferase domain-containing protein [Bacteroidales bacterium]
MQNLDPHNYAVILAGGVGERFWPMSRQYRPKQFIDILGTGKTLIQQTYERFLEILPKENIFVVTNTKFQKLVMEQLPDIGEDRVICEPTRKNTAPCIAYAAWKIYSMDKQARLVVAPSDHIILKEQAFARIIRQALQASMEHEWLFTLGITPSRPDTGYGYIQFVNGSPWPVDENLKKVKTFTEKPNLQLAESFLKSGDFLWNSGIFIWSAHAIIEAFEKYQPEISYVFREANYKYNTPDEIPYMNIAYAACKSISIDYAIMEKADNVYVFVSDFGWSDLGTWGSLYEVRPKDGKQNAVMGKNVILYDVNECIINIPDEKLVVLQGLEDYIVAEADNALLICQKDKEQEIRRFVSDIRLKKGEEFT